MNNTHADIEVKMDLMTKLAYKNQELIMKLILANKSKVSYSLLKEIEQTFNVELRNLWEQYDNKCSSLDKNDPKYHKKEFDLHNSYIKSRNSKMENLVQKFHAEIKGLDPRYYSDLNNKVLKKYRSTPSGG